MKVTISLPGSWWRVPLDAPDAAAHIRAFAADLGGTNDDRALWRATARRSLHRLMAAADRSVVEAMHLGVHLSPQIPLPALVTIHKPLPIPTASTSSAKDVLEAVRAIVQRAEQETAGGSLDPAFAVIGDGIIEADGHLLLKQERYEWSDDGMLAAVSKRYWVPVPGRMDAVLVHIDSPETPFAKLFGTLFDEIALSVRVSPGGLREDLER